MVVIPSLQEVFDPKITPDHLVNYKVQNILKLMRDNIDDNNVIKNIRHNLLLIVQSFTGIMLTNLTKMDKDKVVLKIQRARIWIDNGIIEFLCSILIKIEDEKYFNNDRDDWIYIVLTILKNIYDTNDVVNVGMIIQRMAKYFNQHKFNEILMNILLDKYKYLSYFEKIHASLLIRCTYYYYQATNMTKMHYIYTDNAPNIFEVLINNYINVDRNAYMNLCYKNSLKASQQKILKWQECNSNPIRLKYQNFKRSLLSHLVSFVEDSNFRNDNLYVDLFLKINDELLVKFLNELTNFIRPTYGTADTIIELNVFTKLAHHKEVCKKIINNDRLFTQLIICFFARGHLFNLDAVTLHPFFYYIICAHELIDNNNKYYIDIINTLLIGLETTWQHLGRSTRLINLTTLHQKILCLIKLFNIDNNINYNIINQNNYYCGICGNITENPTNIPGKCKHVFCYCCISNYYCFKTQGEIIKNGGDIYNYTKPCPVCKKKFNGKSDFNPKKSNFKPNLKVKNKIYGLIYKIYKDKDKVIFSGNASKFWRYLKDNYKVNDNIKQQFDTFCIFMINKTRIMTKSNKIKFVNESIQAKLKGNEYLKECKYIEAIKEYKNALNICPLYHDYRAEYYTNIALCYYELKDYLNCFMYAIKGTFMDVKSREQENKLRYYSFIGLTNIIGNQNRYKLKNIHPNISVYKYFELNKLIYCFMRPIVSQEIAILIHMYTDDEERNIQENQLQLWNIIGQQLGSDFESMYYHEQMVIKQAKYNIVPKPGQQYTDDEMKILQKISNEITSIKDPIMDTLNKCFDLIYWINNPHRSVYFPNKLKSEFGENGFEKPVFEAYHEGQFQDPIA